MVTHDAAVSFARRLRELEAESRSSNQFIHVELIPATAARPCAYVVSAADKEIDKKYLPDGVHASGKITFDPQGVPACAATLTFCCGKKQEIVQVDVKGVISIGCGFSLTTVIRRLFVLETWQSVQYGCVAALGSCGAPNRHQNLRSTGLI